MEGTFQSGQMGQTVNLLLIASVVRIHLYPQGIYAERRERISVLPRFFVLSVLYEAGCVCMDKIALVFSLSLRLG